MNEVRQYRASIENQLTQLTRDWGRAGASLRRCVNYYPPSGGIGIDAAHRRAPLRHRSGSTAIDAQVAQRSTHTMAKPTPTKVSKVMREFAKGDLHSGSSKGPKVTNPLQAKAIAMSEARRVSRGEKKR